MSAEGESRAVVGLTGARFGNVRRRGLEQPLPQPVQVALTTPAPDDPIGQTGARFGGAPRRRKLRAQLEVAAQVAVADISAITAIPTQRSAGRVAVPVDPMDDITPVALPVQHPASSAVRPYVLTTGRTRSAVLLSLETLVSAVPTPPAGARTPASAQHRAAVAVCREPRSVAEVAARLGVPLGVAAVLLGDLASAGLVLVHGSGPVTGPDLALMRRVLRGLRRL